MPLMLKVASLRAVIGVPRLPRSVLPQYAGFAGLATRVRKFREKQDECVEVVVRP
jgi:hypothetical protein